MHLDLFVEMNFDQIYIKRNIYTYIDILSDVGGLQSVLVYTIGFFLFVWNYNGLENYMVMRLFKVEP